jgi:uncharacterized cofD-like protein
MFEEKGVKIVVIGGGTGSFALLSGIKNYTNHITALVSMADDGGSTGVLRDELGALPPGDVRQCLVALSRSSTTMRELFNYRFPKDSFAEGHSFGNLFLTALEKITDNFAEAVSVASQVLNVVGQVVPMTLDDIRLVMENANGRIIRNERVIGDESFQGKQMQFRLEPQAKINPAAKKAILQADIVVMAPGDLYTSLAPALLVNGVGEALQKTGAKLVYVCNLVTTHGQTNGYKVHDFAAEIERFIGAPALDYVLYNTKKPSPQLLQRYAKEHEYGVEVDEQALAKTHYKTVGSELLSSSIQKAAASDTLFQRTYIRHDGDKVAKQLMKIYFE